MISKVLENSSGKKGSADIPPTLSFKTSHYATISRYFRLDVSRNPGQSHMSPRA